MSPHRLHPLTPVAAALSRFAEAPGFSWLLGIAAGLVNAVAYDLFGFLFLLCTAASFADYIWGRQVILYLERTDPSAERYSPALASLGWQSKMVGLYLFLLIRGFEWWATSNGVADVPALLSIVVGVVYLKHECDSINKHSKRVGKSIPGLSAILDALDELESRMLPKRLKGD